MSKSETTWGDGQRLSVSSQEDESDQSPHKMRRVSNHYPNYVKGSDSVTGQTSSVSSGTDDDTDTEHRPVLGTGVADEYVRRNPAASNMSGYSTVAEKLMANMGHKKGEGLGKHGQGRVNIVEASKQKGRRGLGMTVNGFEPSDLEWDTDKEVISAEETVDWINKCTDGVPQLDEMQNWVKIGPKKLVLDGECEFCSEDLLTNVIKSKSVFDNLEPEEMRRARTRSNAFETIRGVFFLNRAAMKMANMDAVLDFIFTNPRDAQGKSFVGPNELLYFGDVCAGPGGFSEYVLWRKKRGDTKGFGFTLKGACDFKLEDFFAAPSEMFEPYYGVGGVEGDGDIYKPDNLVAFRDFVLRGTDELGLHFMMADGGFSVEGQENIQEILSKRLYLCQFLAALMNLRPGGHFVCKLFDIFTQFSVGLVYLMYRAFDLVSIFKPVTSRPANSERYIVCKGLRSDAGPIREYVFNLNLKFEQLGNFSQKDIVEVVPLELLHGDDNFFEYIFTSNQRLGLTQVIALSKIQAFCKNSTLHDPRQADMREKCLKLWKIPDELRTAPDRTESAPTRFTKLTEMSNADFWSPPTKLALGDLEKRIRSVFDYRCQLGGSDQRFLLLSLGKRSIYRWDPRTNNKWVKLTKLNEFQTELPRDTLVEGEIVQELRGEGKGQLKVNSLHILDAMFLSGENIMNLHFSERIERLKKFVKAITRPSRIDLAPVRVKDIYRFEEITQMFERLSMRRVKGSSQPKLCYCLQRDVCEDQPRFLTPTGIYFIKTVKDPWMMGMSKKTGMKYFYHTLTREAIHKIPVDSIASFQSCQKSRLYWQWDSSVKLLPEQMHYDSKKLSREHILDFVAKHT